MKLDMSKIDLTSCEPKPARRGRKPIYKTDEEREEARRVRVREYMRKRRASGFRPYSKSVTLEERAVLDQVLEQLRADS